MVKPRIVIIDNDFSYIAPLQSKFIYEFMEDIDLEVITDSSYVEDFFSKMQVMDVLIITEHLFTEEIAQHEITNIFVMTEEPDVEISGFENIHTIFKYTNVKGIFLKIAGESNLKIPTKDKNEETKIIVVTSATGGVGKTTIALGLANALGNMYKRVLYIEAARLQTAQHFFDNQTSIANQSVYSKMTSPGRFIYQEVKSELREQTFTYLPSFKAALVSLGIPYDVYGMIAKSAQEYKPQEFDYIIIDSDVSFDESKAKMINVADKVIVVTEATTNCMLGTNRMMANINNSNSEKYIYVCNKYIKNKTTETNSLVQYKVDEYVEEMLDYEDLSIEDFGEQDSIRKIAFLLI